MWTNGIVKIATVGVGGFLFAVAGSTPVEATVITSSLNCPIVGGSACASPTGSYGTITFSNDANGHSVDIGVALNPGPPLTAQDVFLNYNEALFNSSTPFTAAIGVNSLTVTNNENGITVNGSGNYPGSFDLRIPSNGTLTTFGSAFTIVLSDGSVVLQPENFANFLDTSGNLDFALHLQNCGPSSGTCTPGTTGENSLAVGERPTTTPPIPEPASIALLGAGLAGLGVIRRRKRA